MKDATTPIKRSQALIQFSREHHFGLLLVWKIRQGLKNNTESSRISSYAIFFFENELTAHFKEEEKDLFVKLPADDLLRLQAFAEHEKIYSLIDGIQKDKENINLLKEFADTLDSHIRFEERTLFNHLQQHLSEEALKKLEEGHSKREGDVDDKWDDHFWINK
ncbi:MAG: hemerythrin domain-containing protein [Ferruginibacter sp.]